MSEYQVKILSIKKIGESNYKLLIEKPSGYTFIPGQFAEFSISSDGDEKLKKHFSFTGLNNSGYLEFIIRPCNSNAIKKIISKKTKVKVFVTEARGSLYYKGMGTFIAGGTGITPFISIFRDLKQKNDLAGNKLIYSCKSMDDVILHNGLTEMLGMNYTNVFTKERFKKYYFGRIDSNFLRMEIVDFVQYFYVSGSKSFIDNIISILKNFEVDDNSIIY